ncbi:MAG: methylmalonyl-CoA carboxyltransferase [Chloroflexi bacterium]|nr:methylmalonyl-CoA carboxyltransferase [Chloroflexota bacterium]
MTTQKDQEEQELLRRMTERLKIPPEFLEARRRLKEAKTVAEKVKALEDERRMILQGGGPDAIKKQHERGRLTARERVEKLLDHGTLQELDLWHRPYETGFDIGEERGRGDGVVVGYGQVHSRPITFWAQDATVMGGTVGTVHARKVTMIMKNALDAMTPVVGIFDSEGLRAHDVIQYPEFYSTSAMTYFQTVASGVLPKIALVMGPCAGDMSIVAGLSDFIFMVRGTSYMHLAPPPDGTSGEQLGDAWNVHAKVSGSCDVLAENEDDCLKRCRELLSYLPQNNTEKPPVVDKGDDPNRREEELLEIVPTNSALPYSMYRVISLIVDKGEFFEIKRYWARNLITGFARLDGKTVGIVANNPQDKGGCMNLDAADKMSRFVRFCDAFSIPVIWLADCPAFLPAVDEEVRGLIRHGSGVIYANTEVTTPQITVVLRKLYGGGGLAMPGQWLLGDLNVAWPTQERGLMAPEGAVSIIYRRELSEIKDQGERAKQEKRRILELDWGLDMLLRESTQQWLDPRDTRPFLINALKWLENRKEERPGRKHENIRI